MKKQMASETGKIWLKKETYAYRPFILFLTCLTVVATLFSLGFAYTVRYVLNSATAGEISKLWLFSALLFSFLLFKILLKTATSYFSEKLRAKMTAELRTKIFSKIMRSDYACLQKYHSGDLLNRLTTDIQEVSVDTVGLLPSIAGMLVQCGGAVAALLTIDPLFTLIYVVCGGILIGVSTIFRRHIKKRQTEVLQADGKFRSFMQESTSSVMTLKAYGAEEKIKGKTEEIASVYYQKRMKRNALNAVMNGVFSVLSNFGLIFAVVWCSISVLNGNADYGSILSVILLLMQFQSPLTGFSSVLPVYYARIASGERLSEIESLSEENIQNLWVKSELSYEKLREIQFNDVAFSYGRESVLQGANAAFKKGEIVCLTGNSGSGKSTVFKMLLNVFRPNEGKIQAIEDERAIPLTAKERFLFAYVPQGHFLFSGSIYENLVFFAGEEEKERLDEEIKSALKVACADFVWDLPEGLDTQLTENGGGLSEGQQQRLAVARAILSNRPILLLDEATSALDAETEETLLKNVKALKNKTCIIVTHRPAALQIADRIFVVEDGKILEKQ